MPLNVKAGFTECLRISIDFKKALEDAYHIGYMAGENDMYHDFDERILDIILSQTGLPTYGDQLKDENIKDYERYDFENQQRKFIYLKKVRWK